MIASALLAATTALSGCGLMVLGGAGTAAAVATDRRTAGEQLDDESIELKAGSEMRQLVGEQGRVAATAYAGLVLLTGDVANAQQKQKAGEIVSRIPKVRRVVNELRIGPITELSVRTNDTWITSKVRGNLINTKEVPSRTMVVQTERGVVYLLGKVTAAEGERAGKVAAGVPGVSKVVKLFDIISPASLRDPAEISSPLSTPSAAPQSAPPGTTLDSGPQALPVQ
ncbi:BON domain-containing protein [Pusillimonas sp. TS35]|nr:BON domain-containing protein [Pusillimonas sp. TS35]